MRYSAALSVALVSTIATAGFANAGNLGYGVTFSWASIDTSLISECPQNTLATIVAPPFLMNYLDPGVRAGIQQQLAQMAASGLSKARMLIEFNEGSNVDPSVFNVDTQGTEAAKALAAYSRDVFNAGFDTLFLVFSPQGKMSPNCLSSATSPPGECFDPNTVQDSIHFVMRLRQAVAAPPYRIVSDLGPEMCAISTTPALVQQNISEYLPALVKAYSRRFPLDITGVSCRVQEFPEGKGPIDSIYAQVNKTPGFYPLAVYPNDNLDMDAALADAANALAGSTVPAVVSETLYGDADLVQSIETGLNGIPGGLKGIYFWPLNNPGDQCQIDVAPPYDLSAALGTTSPASK